MNITKLKIWKDLENLGFEKITHSFKGKVVNTGASLRQKYTDIEGKDFYFDRITIEPHSYKYSNKRYHISGKVNSPFTGKFYRYEYGKKVEFFEQVENINNHYSANEILQTVNLMLK